MKKTFLLSCLLMVLGLTSAFAQIQDPVQFKYEWKVLSDTEAQIVFTGAIDEGWHVYSTNLPDGGPISATFNVEQIEGLELDGKMMPEGKEIESFDKVFDMKLRYFEEKAVFVQKLKITAANYFIEGYLEYGSCNDENCLPPTNYEFSISGKGAAGAHVTSSAEEKPATPAVSSNVSTADYWAPVIDKLNAFGEETAQTTNQSWFYIFFAGFIGGLLALFTPCVWPIIPMTVSFFLKRSKDKKKGIRDAWTYGASIVVIYVTLGLAITLIFGASALNALSTNAVFNILFFLMLVVFAASFFGAFEITLPSKWSNAVDSKAEQTSGLLSIFLMAFTLALVSFSCTGPIIGFLLVEVSTSGGSALAPTIGMLGFAIALALPFSLFAMFPTLLKSAPKSGGWLNAVKVCLGFLELAFALKFFSVADLAYGWGIMDREVFLALWIIIFALLGVYLLGWLRFPHDDEATHTSVPRFFLALFPLAFAVYMIPGLWGAPCKAISAFAPPMSTQDFNLQPDQIETFKNYEEGMAYARKVGKPVFLDFTGHGCVNCRKMEASVWESPVVKQKMQEDYVVISLYVDEKEKLAEPIDVVVGGMERKLRTVGDKWSYLQQHKFGANAQPFYVLVDHEGKPLNQSYSYDEDIDKFVQFLDKGKDAFDNKK